MLEDKINQIKNEKEKGYCKADLKELRILEKRTRFKKYLLVKNWLYLAYETLLDELLHAVKKQLELQEKREEGE